jgi:hypothetical protein
VTLAGPPSALCLTWCTCLPGHGGEHGQAGRAGFARAEEGQVAGRAHRGRGGLRVAAGTVAGQLQAQPDQVIQRAGIDVGGDNRGDQGVAGQGPGGIPVQPGAAVAPGALGPGGPAGGPPDPHLVTHSVSSSDPSSIACSSASETCAHTLTG